MGKIEDEYYKIEDLEDENYDWDEDEEEISLRKRKHEQVCIFCGSSKNTVISNSKIDQFYCKKCNKYFKPNSKRKKYSNKEKLIYNVINSLFQSHSQDSMSLKKFLKKINQKNTKKFANCDIKFQSFKKSKKLEEVYETRIDNGFIENSIIITKVDEDFIITNGLTKRQIIRFDNGNIKIPGKIYSFS